MKLLTLNKENNFVSIWKKIEHLEGTYEPEKICNFENSMLFLKRWQKQFWKEDFVKFENETNGIDFDCDYKEDIDNKKQSWFKFEEITMAVNMRGNRTWPVDNDNDNGSIIISLTPQNANCTLLDCLKGGKSEGADEDDTYVRSRDYDLYRPKGEGSDGKREAFDNDFVPKK